MNSININLYRLERLIERAFNLALKRAGNSLYKLRHERLVARLMEEVRRDVA